MARVRVQTVEDFVAITTDEMLSPEARQQVVADFARKELVEAQDANRKALGRDTPYEQYVDGRKGAKLESVNPDRGTIVFEFELFFEVLSWIYNTLVERSPRLSGAYAAGHRLFADGKEIPVDGEIPPAEEYSFLNMLPYSRRLEIGKTKSGRDFLVSVPNRIYQRTAKDAHAKFGNIATVSFTYRGVVSGAPVNAEKLPVALKRRSKNGRFVSSGASREHNVASVRFPTITVKPR